MEVANALEELPWFMESDDGCNAPPGHQRSGRGAPAAHQREEQSLLKVPPLPSLPNEAPIPNQGVEVPLRPVEVMPHVRPTLLHPASRFRFRGGEPCCCSWPLSDCQCHRASWHHWSRDQPQRRLRSPPRTARGGAPADTSLLGSGAASSLGCAAGALVLLLDPVPANSLGLRGFLRRFRPLLLLLVRVSVPGISFKGSLLTTSSACPRGTRGPRCAEVVATSLRP